MDENAWQVMDETICLDERYIKVVRQRVKLPTGIVIDDFHLVQSPSWAATVALTKRRELILVQQYRHGHQGLSLELPAGVIEPDEDPMHAALRELEEETGYSAPNIEPLWTTRPEPARHRQQAHFGFVEQAEPTAGRALDPTEDLDVILVPVQELSGVLDKMVHAAHVAALLLAERRGLLTP